MGNFGKHVETQSTQLHHIRTMVSNRVAPPVAWTFQPDCSLKIALQGNFRCGYEKLLRRNHPVQWPTCGPPIRIKWRVVRVG